MGFILKRSTFVGQKPSSLVQGPDTDPAAIHIIRQAIKAGKGITAEILNYHKSVKKYWVELTILSRNQ